MMIYHYIIVVSRSLIDINDEYCSRDYSGLMQ